MSRLDEIRSRAYGGAGGYRFADADRTHLLALTDKLLEALECALDEYHSNYGTWKHGPHWTVAARAVIEECKK